MHVLDITMMIDVEAIYGNLLIGGARCLRLIEHGGIRSIVGRGNCVAIRDSSFSCPCIVHFKSAALV